MMKTCTLPHPFLLITSSLLMLLTGCASQPQRWDFALGSVRDQVWSEEINMYRKGALIHTFRGGRDLRSIDPDRYRNGYYWRREVHGTAYEIELPDKISVQWVSYADKARYRAVLELPSSLRDEMNKQHACTDKTSKFEKADTSLSIGVAPGAYIEVYVYHPCNTKYTVLASGFGKPYSIEYDQRAPISKQYKKRWKRAENEYPDVFKQHPLPKPEAWSQLIKFKNQPDERYL